MIFESYRIHSAKSSGVFCVFDDVHCLSAVEDAVVIVIKTIFARPRPYRLQDQDGPKNINHAVTKRYYVTRGLARVFYMAFAFSHTKLMRLNLQFISG